MRYRTGFVTNSSSVSFYVGRKGEKPLTEDDVFDMLKECWNDYYDCAEQLIQYILSPEAKEEKRQIDMGNGEEILERLERQFNIYVDDMEFYMEYDSKKKQVIRKQWLEAKTYEEALKLDIDEDDIQIFVLGDEKCAASVDRYRRREALKERNFESREEYEKAWEELNKEGPINFDLQLGLNNMGLVEGKEVQEECEQCQVIVETWDSHIPMGVYDRMKAKALGAVYHGC